MARKQTDTEYKDDCRDIHNLRYGYDDAIYISGKHKIEITCYEHGNFWQLAESHKQGTGCPACAREVTEAARRLTQQDFDERVKEAHPSLDFSESVYKNNKTKVSVNCLEHGKFEARPEDLFKGVGCKKCSNELKSRLTRSTTEEFVYKACVVKEHYYTYPRTIYTGSKNKVIITCPLHGDFLQAPDNHLMGAGCPTCGKSGFNRNKPATMYILNSGDTTKVGITGRSVNIRVKQLVNGGSPDFEVMASFYFKDGAQALNLETHVLQWLSPQYNRVKATYVGSTECFLNVDLAALLNYATPLATTEAA